MTGLPANVVKAKSKNEGLKFKKPSANFETSSQVSTMSAMTDKQLSHDNQMLTNELLIATGNLKTTKAELKKCQEALKKLEKETTDSRKQLDVKEQALEKARKDRDTLWSTINSDKFSNFSNFEEEKTKIDMKVG